MKIVVVGGGVVGTATALGFERLGHEVYIVDPNSKCHASQYGLKVVPDCISDGNYILLCTPEAEIDAAIQTYRLPSWDDSRKQPPIYVRSSVLPGTCRRLSQKYGLHIGHNPELLREAVAEYEFMNPSGIILGDCCSEHGFAMEILYMPFRSPVHHTTPEVSELTKLAINSYLVCNISYWNQIKLLADKLDINSHEVGMLASHVDDRISVYGSRMHGRPYGGKCLPKDLKQLIGLSHKINATSLFFESIRDMNDLMENLCSGTEKK